MTYDAARNSIASHALALAECRRMYLAGRLDGETAAEWLIRTRPHSSLRACAQFAEQRE